MIAKGTRGIAYTSLFTALICCCSFIRIDLPFTPIPVTLQMYAVFLGGTAQSRKNAVLSAFVYIMLGAIGLPVFSGFRGGIGVLAGHTGGFITGFPLGMLVMSALSGRGAILWRNALAMLAGLAVIYTFGVIQFILVANTSLYAALTACVLPFVLPDLVKIGLAAVTVKRLNYFAVSK